MLLACAPCSDGGGDGGAASAAAAAGWLRCAETQRLRRSGDEYVHVMDEECDGEGGEDGDDVAAVACSAALRIARPRRLCRDRPRVTYVSYHLDDDDDDDGNDESDEEMSGGSTSSRSSSSSATGSSGSPRRRSNGGRWPRSRPRTFPCLYPGCNERLRSEYNRRVHARRWHGEERPHTCDEDPSWCLASFATSSQLAAHVRSFHTASSPSSPLSSPASASSVSSIRKYEEHRCAQALVAANVPHRRERSVWYKEVAIDADIFAEIERRSARIDFWLPRDDCLLLLECDENEHQGWWAWDAIYHDALRMYAVMRTLRAENFAEVADGRPIVWVRYNPNEFTVDGEQRTVPREQRERRLVELLSDPRALASRAVGDVDNGGGDDDDLMRVGACAILYLYYDCRSAQLAATGEHAYAPVLLDDPNYCDALRSRVQPVVID